MRKQKKTTVDLLVVLRTWSIVTTSTMASETALSTFGISHRLQAMVTTHMSKNRTYVERQGERVQRAGARWRAAGAPDRHF